jgi:hypothetical protein
VETWVEERSWGKIEKLLPKEYKWECQRAKRGKKKRRATERKFGNFWNDVLLSLLSLMKEKREKTSKGGYLFLPFLFQEKLNLDI